MKEQDKIKKDIERLEGYGSPKGMPDIPKPEAVYVVLKEVNGKLELVGETNTSSKESALKKADDLAIGNGSDYLVAKIISRHKKRIFTDVISYE